MKKMGFKTTEKKYDSKLSIQKIHFLKKIKTLSLNGTKSYQVIRYIYKWYLQKLFSKYIFHFSKFVF